MRQSYHQRAASSHATLGRYLVAIGVVVTLAVFVTVFLVHLASPKSVFDISRVATSDILLATANTFARMAIAYLFALAIAVPAGLLIASTARAMQVLLPIADVLQSVPVLAFFPVIVVYFTKSNQFEVAAIFVIFMTMLWNIVFPVVAGLQIIPDDIKSAAIVFKIRGILRFWHITLPAIFPFVVNGSFMAWAQGWTIVIVAEVLHTYIPNGSPAQDLLGLGSLLVDSNAQGRTGIFVAALVTMILLVTLMNLLVWQPLLRLTQRFRFD